VKQITRGAMDEHVTPEYAPGFAWKGTGGREVRQPPPEGGVAAPTERQGREEADEEQARWNAHARRVAARGR
jgi:hypothetical protein